MFVEQISILFLFNLAGTCEPITISLCQNVGYEYTSVPNLMGHTNQEDAGSEVSQFYPLVKVGCSDVLGSFLCAMYAPKCVAGQTSVQPPCKELCQKARQGCEALMVRFGYSWPQSLDCDTLPEKPVGGSPTKCYDGKNANKLRIYLVVALIDIFPIVIELVQLNSLSTSVSVYFISMS